MRCSGSCRNGFTLLEMVLALLCSAILVAALVAVWIQVVRTSTATALESAAQSRQVTLQRRMVRLASSLRWTPTSHLPQGALPWRAAGTSIQVWSGESFGTAPGLAAWVFEEHGGAWTARGTEDNSSLDLLPMEDVAEFRLELLRGETGAAGERVEWIPLETWDPALPFRPLAFRFRWKDRASLVEFQALGSP